MAKRRQFRRLLTLALLLAAAFAGLGYRLVDLQVLRHDELSAKAQQNTQREFLLEPRRGDILDAKGNLLATSVFVKTVCADPHLMGDRKPEVARALAPLLGMSEGELLQKFLPRITRNENGEIVTNATKYVRLKKRVPLETWQQIQAAMNHLDFGLNEKTLNRNQKAFYRELRQSAIFAQDDQLRFYPNQALAAHILGFASSEETNVQNTAVTQLLGKDGIELNLDSKLRGVRGWRLTETDSHKHELVALREQNVEPHDGLDVVLTIDSVIQHMVEQALAEGMEKLSPVSISGIVVRPRTGEILAMATLPNYDPNNLKNTTDDMRRNRVITEVAEPGSTFKIVVISGALNDQTVKLTDVFDCGYGHFYYAGKNLHDHVPCPPLSVTGIITKSSNIGAAKVGIKMGENRLYEYMQNFGFGMRTGIPLPAESPGIMPPVKKWSKLSIAQIPMGQGVAVTRLQMIMAMCAIANNGKLMRPMLVDRLEDRDQKVVVKYEPQCVRQVISESTARLMVTALKTVVATNGTAPKAALDHYTVAGKTGTAQKSGGAAGYLPGKYFSSFIGFFPADDPELCISVMMDEPDIHKGYYGGQTAAPIFKQIAERAANYLNIRPEDSQEPTMADTSATAVQNRGLKPVAARLQ